MCHHAQLIFCIFSRDGDHVGQAGLELLTSSDLPASASQSTGIIGVSHCTWPVFYNGSSCPLQAMEVACTWEACYISHQTLNTASEIGSTLLAPLFR